MPPRPAFLVVSAPRHPVRLVGSLHRPMRTLRGGACVATFALLAACSGGTQNQDGGLDAVRTDTTIDSPVPPDASDAPTTDSPGDGGRAVLTAAVVSSRFVTREHMLASLEMQQSGEPLAQAMGRNLAGYDRNQLPPNLYTDPTNRDAGAVVDLPGFASGIESYEYSKQPMNNLALEGGAGVSLLFAPLVNPSGVTGQPAIARMLARVQHYAISSHVGVPAMPGVTPRGYVVPVDGSDPLNRFGWRGLWPTLQPYAAFDPTIQPVSGVSGGCSITPGDGDDGRAGVPANPVGDYECDYNTLHLPNRTAQIDPTISPGATGWSAWKFALWITNYLQSMHDVVGNPIVTVGASDLATVGSVGNTIVGTTNPPVGSPAPGMPGTYLGSSDIEGFQAAIMIDELENAAEQDLLTLNTTDGHTLSGFASLAAALDYDYASPLRWIPASIAVTEVADPSGFPRPSAYAISSGDSHLIDWLGLMGSYAQLFALTDHANPDVGGTQSAMAYFDGDPFPADNQVADGEYTLHDRALAMLKFALVSVDRMHRSASGVLVDDVSIASGSPVAGSTLQTTTAAYVMVSLRALRRGLSSNLTLYSNSTPDSAVITTVLDGTPFNGAPGGPTSVAARITALIQTHADLLFDHLTDDTGTVYTGWNTATQAPVAGAATLDASAGAIRGLLEAFLATGNSMYRDRALTVFTHMDATLFDPSVRMYRVTVGGDIDFTPMRFALVQSALREIYKLVAVNAGEEALATQLLQRIARLDKLVLNGWDDVNDDGVVDWPTECTQVRDGLPRGGLQMAERALSGELGLRGHTPASDRDHDCVPEVSYAQMPAALAAEVRWTTTP